MTDSVHKPRPRKLRRSWNNPGDAHFLTYSCFKRWPLLTKDRTRQWVIDAMDRTRRELNVSLWAYAIMPEHVHLLLTPNQSDYDMRPILVSLKKPVSVAARKHLEATGNKEWLQRLTVKYPSRQVFRFWQPGGGFDHNVFKEKTIPAIVDYIHANPVRRELVKSAADWEWSSFRFWEGDRNVPLPMDDPFD